MNRNPAPFPRPWQSIFDALSEAVCLLDLEGRILNYNRAMIRLLKKPADQILGFSCCRLVHGNTEPIPGCPVNRMRRSLRKETLRWSLNGRTLNLSADPLFDESDRLIGAVHIISEIPGGLEGLPGEERTGRDRLRLLLGGVLKAQESEKQGVVRALQNEVGQALLTVKANLQAALTHPDSMKRSVPLQENIQIIDRVWQQLNRLAMELHPPILDELGLIPALSRFIDHRSRDNGITLQFPPEMSSLRFPPEVELICFRIIQEALRRDQAAPVSITFTLEKDSLRLFILDKGRIREERPEADSEEGLRRSALEERIRLVNGRIAHSALPGRGTEIHLTIPLPL